MVTQPRHGEGRLNRASQKQQNPISHRPEVRINDTQENPEKQCFFFSNYGWCKYEERTGRKCKFIHSAPVRRRVPLCQQGINCSRLDCPYSHPRINGNWNQNNYSESANRGFLGNGMNVLNPWQAQAALNQLFQQANQGTGSLPVLQNQIFQRQN